MATPIFTWGSCNSESFAKLLHSVYTEVVHWRPNLFKLPQGNAGKAFVTELARLYAAFATGSALESVAMTAVIVLPILLLQKPSRSSKAKDHIACIERRLLLWRDGQLDDLLAEGRTLQERLSKLPSDRKKKDNVPADRLFANKMFQGKVKSALNLLTNKTRGGLLHLDDKINGPENEQSVRDVLREKHPSGKPANPGSLICDVPPTIHPVVFDSIDKGIVRSAALKASGAAGPSGLDAYCWRRLCTCFGPASSDLCQALADVAKRLCTSYVDPASIAPFVACRLIALNKNPGARPIGIGDTARRIIAKSVLMIISGDIQDAAGTMQLCAGQISGIEAAVHAVRSAFEDRSTEAVLLVDASNAFNTLNRKTALHNIRSICPTLSTILINTYRADSDLFMDGDVLHSSEGTTQGDPLAMPMYAVATIPLIKESNNHAKQVWYADDASATGKIADIREWWESMCTLGPRYGYFPKASKTWLITKNNFHSTAVAAFGDTDVQITTEGRPYLGSPIGTTEYIQSFTTEKVQDWLEELELLATFGITQPHAAHSAFTHGLVSKWSYLCRTTPDIGLLLRPLEASIRSTLIPAITDRPPPSDCERELLALPARHGGIALTDPTERSQAQYEASIKITSSLTEAILKQDPDYSIDIMSRQITGRHEVHALNRQKSDDAATILKHSLPCSLNRAMDLASEKGASSWLTTLPIEEFGFALHKGAFHDALALRYDWNPSRTPTNCACGKKFTVEHAFTCPKGGFPILRHNEIRDLTANLLTEVCHDVSVEPYLQPLTGEVLSGPSSIGQDGARLDIAASGCWGGRHERTYFDVRVFNPHAPSNRCANFSTCYRKHEKLKKNSYEQRIREVEHATFTPLVLAATGGLASEANNFYKRLASLLAAKWNNPYNSTLSWLRCRLSFSLLRSAIRCIRGARSSCGHALKSPASLDLVRSEANMNAPI